ncbi:2Fe-2S ferredoxin-type domain-containing protein [Boletus coccyginus]|nr:2Fe-2S ferredoxin-type domain-containing protein [Boletus coccyginus]
MSASIHIPVELARITTSALGLRISMGGTFLRGRSSWGDIQSRRAFHQLLRQSWSPPTPTQCSWNISGALSQRRRWLHTSGVRRHGTITRPTPGTGFVSTHPVFRGPMFSHCALVSITLHFKDHKGNPIKTIEANEGDDILSLAHEWDIDLEGACEGSIACSTCHIIIPPEHYDNLPEPSDDENDMLDLAFGLTDTSRLGCQVHVTRNMDEMEIRLPSATRNMFVDGKKSTHH